MGLKCQAYFRRKKTILIKVFPGIAFNHKPFKYLPVGKYWTVNKYKKRNEIKSNKNEWLNKTLKNIKNVKK